MIIITGHDGFIGKKFLEKLKDKEIIKVEKLPDSNPDTKVEFKEISRVKKMAAPINHKTISGIEAPKILIS